MRRQIVLTTVLAAAAFAGACNNETKPNAPESKTPVSTPAPVAPASPINGPVASPTASPAKPGASPDVKKTDIKTTDGTNKDVKPVATITPKAK